MRIKKVLVFSFVGVILSPALVVFGLPLVIFLVAVGMTICLEKLLAWGKS